jgi:hypothetical protein
LTRFCRAKFERDDLAEARIICGVDSAELQHASEQFSSDDDDNQRPIVKGKAPEHCSRFGHWTWKLSGRIGFSYRTMIHHKRHNQRLPNPFGRSSAESSIPLEPTASTAGLVAKESQTVDASAPSLFSNNPIHESPVEEDPPNAVDDTRPTLVVNHPPLPLWDDDSNPDTPYDNPYYTRPISDSLWLPRDPLGILNLDDTVDLRMSLTSEPSAGRLGAWQEDEFLYSAISSAFVTSFGSVDADSISIQPSRHLDGSEAIAPPEGVASRIGSSLDIPQRPQPGPRRPSTLAPRRPSDKSDTGDTLSGSRQPSPQRPSLRRPATASAQFRSFSLGTESVVSSRPTSSHLTVPTPTSHRQRSSSVDALSVGAHSVSPSQLAGPPGSLNPGAPALRSVLRMPSFRVPSSRSLPGAASVISTREVVVNEAIAEEQVAAQRRMRREEANEERANEPHSWLTSWIYAKGH